MGTWKHRLSEVDLATMSGVCAACGPVRLHLGSNKIGVRCSFGSKLRKNPAATAHPKARTRTSVESLRKMWRANKGSVCSACGFVPKDQCQLDVHHKDEDHYNSSPENLVTLCANCHRLEHAKRRSHD